MPELTAAQLAAAIDHTLLKPDATSSQVDDLCREALEHRFASVCINSVYVPRAAATLGGSPVKVCTVNGFPLGACLTEAKVCEARESMARGASEIDMVLAVGRLKSNRDDEAYADVLAVVEACHAQGALVKVIIEACLLTDDEKVRACRLAQAAGADFVKTSTGFSTGWRDRGRRAPHASHGRRGDGRQSRRGYPHARPGSSHARRRRKPNRRQRRHRHPQRAAGGVLSVECSAT